MQDQEKLEKQIFEEAHYLINKKETLRNVAKVFGRSKSKIHIDVTLRLRNIDFDLYLKVREVLNYNASQRHLRGGEATRMKYLL